jgi:hypothetical protein
MAREGIPLDGLSFRFFLWVIVPVLWCIAGVSLLYVLEIYTGGIVIEHSSVHEGSSHATSQTK